MGERRGTKGLELWCRRMTDGYPGVNVTNMTTSWRDGLAFCAIIHHFRPDLIEFSKLNKDDIYYNNELAFRTAEHHLGIPALLEPEDMVEFPVPDRLSILTYLSQFYQTFVVGQGKSAARIAPKRPATSPESSIVSPASTSPPSKVAAVPSAGARMRREPCARCGHPVFIAERLNVGKLLYHRTCFRCARCHSQLTLANYYETEGAEFCCETCPDEEAVSPAPARDDSVLTKSLSDEEKSASLKTRLEEEAPDDYSARFETALEEKSLSLSSSRYSDARSFFVQSQVAGAGEAEGGGSGTDEDEPPDLPDTLPPPRPSTDDGGGGGGGGAVGEETRRCDVTKETMSDARDDAGSLVRARMRLFESKADDSVGKEVPSRNSPSATSDNGDVVNHTGGTKSHSFKDDIVDSKDDTSPGCDNAKSTVKDVVEVVQVIDDSIITISDTTSEEKTNDHSIITVSDDSDHVREVADASTMKNRRYSEELRAPVVELPEKPDAKNRTDSLEAERSTLIVELSERPEAENRTEPEEAKGSIPMVELPEETEASPDLKEEEERSRPEEDGVVLLPPSRRLKSKLSEEYPDDLNPFGEEDEKGDAKPPVNVSLNPFEGDEDEEEEVVPLSPKPAARKKIQPTSADRDCSHIYIKRISENPFEKEDEEEEEKPQPARRKVIAAPKISLNPFWSDDEEREQEDRPVPKPRISKSSAGVPEPKPRESAASSTTYSSLSSVTSSQSGSATKKKKPAPKPPSMFGGTESGHSSLTSSPSHSVTHSPRATPKIRKNRKAPLPPTSTPLEGSTAPPEIDIVLGEEFEKEKSAKDEVNRNRQSLNLSLQSPSSSENSSSLGAPNKSTYGKWKRRKGQAPARPIPQRRVIKSLPMVEVKRELEVIEIQQQGLEKQGVKLEQIIRGKCERPEINPDDSLPPEIEEMVLQLFELVNEKNELFRRQAELMYLRRQHKLEEEHAEIEYQIRCLMLQPEANKTDSDKAKEEELINRLVEIVERRNEIIECLEMDRVREAEEDDSINNQLNLYSLKKEDKSSEKKGEKKEKKKHRKEKKFKLKSHKVDADKDIDESETSTSLVKDKKKKKFNIF